MRLTDKYVSDEHMSDFRDIRDMPTLHQIRLAAVFAARRLCYRKPE